MADLFELGDLGSILRDPGFDLVAGGVARRMAYGWLRRATGLTADWPVPAPDDLYAWAIELAAIAYRNPAGAASESIDDYNVSYDAERRQQILEDAEASSYNVNGGGPQFSFPAWDWHWKASDVQSNITA